MDYEKKYKDALEWARKVMQGKVGFVLDEVLEKFPELKESEGDKTRKAIYNCVKWFGFDSCFFKDVSQEECLAWLEKQDEQKTAEDRYMEGYLNGINDMSKTLKPATWSEDDENIKEGIITGLEMLKDGASDESLIALYNKKIDWLKSLKDRVQPKT